MGKLSKDRSPNILYVCKWLCNWRGYLPDFGSVRFFTPSSRTYFLCLLQYAGVFQLNMVCLLQYAGMFQLNMVGANTIRSGPTGWLGAIGLGALVDCSGTLQGASDLGLDWELVALKLSGRPRPAHRLHCGSSHQCGLPPLKPVVFTTFQFLRQSNTQVSID